LDCAGSGGLAVGGTPAKPYWPERYGRDFHRGPDGGWVWTRNFDAGCPPVDWPEQEPGESNDAYFARLADWCGAV
jgi:hypothetical protein